MKISDILNEENIEINLKSTTKKDVLIELCELLNKGNYFNKIEDIQNAIFEREKLSTTGIGHKIAIPHARVSHINKVFLALGISKKGIDFESLDHTMTHIFFIMVSPKNDTKTHVKILAEIAKSLKDEAYRNRLLECQGTKEIVQLIKEKEEKAHILL